MKDNAVVTIEEGQALPDRSKVCLRGILVAKKVFTSASEKSMARAVLEDGTGYIEVVIPPEVFQLYGALCNIDSRIEISGFTDVEHHKVSLIMENARLV